MNQKERGRGGARKREEKKEALERGLRRDQDWNTSFSWISKGAQFGKQIWRLGGTALGKSINNFAALLHWDYSQNNSCAPDADFLRNTIAVPETCPLSVAELGRDRQAWFSLRSLLRQIKRSCEGQAVVCGFHQRKDSRERWQEGDGRKRKLFSSSEIKRFFFRKDAVWGTQGNSEVFSPVRLASETVWGWDKDLVWWTNSAV